MAERRARNPLSPTKLPQPQYEAEMWDHLKTREGMANRIYTDGKGIPTMGVGVALAVKGKDERYSLRSPDQIGAEISGDRKSRDGFALGRFNTFARDAQRGGNPEGLESATHGAFGSLFRDPADSKAPKVEGGVLQETQNDLGSRSHDDWEPLKVDTWIGPKTTDAFGKVLKTEDADSFTTAFGRGLGLL